MKKIIYQSLIELTNNKKTSLLVQKAVESPVSRKWINGYIRTFSIETNGLLKDKKEFTSLQDFFIRQYDRTSQLPELPIDTVISPVDAKVESMGAILDQGTFQVKGQAYSIERLIDNEKYASKFKNGYYFVLYLSPADYHRIHAPVSGEVVDQFTRGGNSYPVNQLGLKYGKQPLSDNYRVTSIIESNSRQLAVVKVGAMFVNAIHVTETSGNWERGQEVAYFGFGSTVVLLFEKDSFTPSENVALGGKIRVGEPLGYML